MGVYPIYKEGTKDTTRPIIIEKSLDGHDFKIEIYLLPIVGKGIKKVKTELINRLGNRRQNEKPCLGIDEGLVSENIENNEYSAIIFVKNKKEGIKDEASGTLQYYNWCTPEPHLHQDGEKQIWINDLCRITDPSLDKKSLPSPIKVFLLVVEEYVKKELNLNHIDLMVENKDEDTKKALINVYSRYGFEVIDETKCNMKDDDNEMKDDDNELKDKKNEYTIMRKEIGHTEHTGGKRKNTRTKKRRMKSRKTRKSFIVKK